MGKAKKTPRYLLVYSDGFSIDAMSPFKTLEEAREVMRQEYQKKAPDDSEWEEEFRDLSYCEDRSAQLYYNGEDVYIWNIIEILW